MTTTKTLKKLFREQPPTKVVCPHHGQHTLTLSALLKAHRRGQLCGTWGTKMFAGGVCCNTATFSVLVWD